MTELSHPLSQITVFGPDWNGKPFWQLNALTPHLFANLPEATRQQEDRIHSLRTLALNMTGDGEGEDVAMRRPRLVALQLLVGQGRARKEKIADGDKIVFNRYEAGFSYATSDTNFKNAISCPEGFHNFTPSRDYYVGVANRTESFSIQLNFKTAVEVSSKQSWIEQKHFRKDLLLVTPSYFRTGFADAGPEDPKQPRDAEFQHVIATPVLHDREPWLPNYNDAHKGGQFAKEIRVPPMRLLHGAIDLAVADGAFPWLGDFQPPVSPRSTEHRVSRFVLRLTPDGIELTTKVNFPGQTTPLQGRFLLGPETTLGNSDGMAEPSTTPRLMLTFLPDKTDPLDLLNWKRAWQAVIPALGSEELLHGFRIAAQANVLPAFRWEVLLAGDKPENLKLGGLSPAVEIPAQHIRLELLSPRSNGGIDGVVNVTGGYFYLLEKKLIDQNWTNRIFGNGDEFNRFTENLDAELLLAWSKPAKAKPAGEKSSPQLRMTGGARNSAGVMDANELTVEMTGSSYLCAHDEFRLAEQLRQAYGLPALQPGTWDPKRPLLYGFLPMNDGWLQLPVPNYPTPDNSLDSALVAASGSQKDNILSGFLRYQQQAALPLVQSAFAPGTATALDTQAPWSITVESAQGLRAVVALKKVAQDSMETARPTRAMALLNEPELSTRGLLWLSADRPDALEALPRLGAGPGVYLDLPLERLKPGRNAILSVAINALNLSATARADGNNGLADAVTRRKQVDLEIKFNKDKFPKATAELNGAAVVDVEELLIKPVYWQRHPQMPLVSQMPMTRTASSSVRPLESRDLVPFEIQTKPVPPSPQVSLAELSWTHAVFPKMAARDHAVHSAWPWPAQKVVSAKPLTVNGIGLCAFGVPGVELRLPNDVVANPWGRLQATLRYDLPVLDEAFASATLPPAPALNDQAVSAPAADTLAATALDWHALVQFWHEQNRLHQLTRVAHSYLIDYFAVGNLGTKKIENLVGGFIWETDAGFTEGSGHDALLYGGLWLNGKLAAGNVALQGYKNDFCIDGGKLRLANAAEIPDIRVVGYSPSYFLKDDFLLDARGSGAAQVKQIGDVASETSGLWRPLKALVTQSGLTLATGLLSCESVLNVASVQAGGLPLFRFWFKDLPISKTGDFIPAPGIDTSAWQDGHLLQSGFEWRLLAASGHAGFENGDDLIAFCGMQLEPLQLLALQVPMTAAGAPGTALPSTVKILARLSLGSEQEWPDHDNSLLELEFLAMADGLYLQAVNVSTLNTGTTLRLPLVLAQKSLLLQIHSMAWTGQLHLRQASMSFDFLEAKVVLECDEVAIDPAGAGRWELKSTPPTDKCTNALMIAEAVLTVEGSNLRFKMAYVVSVSPQAVLGVVDTENPAISICGTDHWSDLTLAPNADLYLLGAKAMAQVRLIAARRAFSVIAQTTDNDGIDLTGELLPGFPSGGKLQFGMLASIGEFDDRGVAKLVAGQIGGRIVKTTPSKCMTLAAMDFSATCLQRGNDSVNMAIWSGALVLYGSITVRNAIGWPQIDLNQSGKDIPYPSTDPATLLQSSLTKVVLRGDKNYSHEVQWQLDGHSMSFDLAQGMREKIATAVWSAPIMARHALFLPGTEPVLEFSCVEALAMGAMAALLPRWEGANTATVDATARNTFAPRYRDQILNGQDTGDRTPGMLHAGHGGLGTVLQGALSGAFRAACYASGAEDSHIVLAGGFVGMLLDDANIQGNAPLMRLPVLAGLHEGPLFVDRAEDGTPPVTQRRVTGEGLRLAWSDGAATPKIRVTMRHGVAASGGSERALRDAMAAGNLSHELEALGDPQMAILVEQSYPHDLAGSLPMDTPENRKQALKVLPFFISSAVSIERAIDALKPSPTVKLRMCLSLLAGSDFSRKHKDKMQRGAALLLTRQGSPAAAPGGALTLQPAPAILMLVADDLVTQTWDGPRIAHVQQPIALVASKAYAAHRRPRAALLRDASGQYISVAIPAHHLQLQKRSAVTPVFADSGRGYALATGKTQAWLAGPEEGGAMAVRDFQTDADGNGTGSGIAGFSRNAALRASASDGPPIWLGQQRAPIYLPLQTRDLTGPAVPWLTPGAARTRLPTDASVKRIQDKLSDATPSTIWQTIVPQQVMSASLSDRPGILMSRRMRLESRFANGVWRDFASKVSEHAFDSDHERFGQPAQAGFSLARTERTPRPGPLPPNQNDLGEGGKSDPRFYRRPCASPLLPLVPLRALIGPADTVRGKIEKSGDDAWTFSDWSVTFVAAPETAGVITQASDGTLGLIAEIDVWPQTTTIDGDGWKKILLSLLFVDGNKEDNKASAVLMIESVAMPFNTLHIRGVELADAPGTNVARGRVRLILDVRVAPPAAVGPVSPDLANALSGSGPLPAVAVQLTVYPASSLPTVSEAAAWDTIKQQYPLSGATATVTNLPAGLSKGSARAPVSLRMNLSPVLRERGALPLQNAALLFTDPAYDIDLAAPPYDDRKTLSETQPGNRGQLELVLYADRRRINRRATVTLMVDVRYQKNMDARLRAMLGEKVDGDLKPGQDVDFKLSLRLQPRSGNKRDVFLSTPGNAVASVQIKLAQVYELALSALREADGSPANLEAGDMLELELRWDKGALSVVPDAINVPSGGFPSTLPDDFFESGPTLVLVTVPTLRLVLTDEPVIEPPSALYAALVHNTAADTRPSLSVPLYAQSPLPWRVDLQNAKADFRAELMQRSATFIWSLGRPNEEFLENGLAVHIVKSDRNGQTYLPPAIEGNFINPERLIWVS